MLVNHTKIEPFTHFQNTVQSQDVSEGILMEIYSRMENINESKPW